MANMYEINEILHKATNGEITAEEANKMLLNMGVTGIGYDPNTNVITEDDMKHTSVSGDMETIDGFVLLDTGTGYKNKVRVVNNTLMDVDIGNMYGLAIVGDLQWEVKGNKIVKFKGKKKV